VRAAILTISTSRAAGDGADESGDALADFASALGIEVVGREVLPDDRELISARLVHWADEDPCDLVLTTGGTGFSPNDLTPEATRSVIEREAPGIPEAMRAASRPHTRHWMLSRAVAGIRGATLIVNFPGSPESIGEAGEAIGAALPHALELLAGKRSAH
jgi:molybdopterin adenylyltransferase